MTKPACPHCQRNDLIIKSGVNKTGTQRYRCQRCLHYFTPKPRFSGYELTLRSHVLQLHREGLGVRQLGRLLGIPHQTVSNWVNKAVAHLPNPMTFGPSEPLEPNELDSFLQHGKPLLLPEEP